MELKEDRLKKASNYPITTSTLEILNLIVNCGRKEIYIRSIVDVLVINIRLNKM